MTDLTRKQIEDMSTEERQKRLPEINEWAKTYRGEPGHKLHLTPEQVNPGRSS
ncbi:hypothetical protein SAMN05660199_00174 [Klenkia soli]|uniref:Uncharacterized protein n=1 Tax=Klenkia soli TaxID=1052260 RepID=A0A1H0C105_9ACTN|nr:hypothetical protein [Klenkia soli]SDN51535.1 hypothetical protein SAMN05660199_00174 [Klenkia soli]